MHSLNSRMVLLLLGLVIAIAGSGAAFAECPMASANGRFLMVQETAEALNGGWTTTRILYDLNGAAAGKTVKLYTADDVTAERPDLDYVPRSLRVILEKHGVVAKCLPPIRAASKKIVTTASGCGVKVTVDGKSVGTAKISFGESAMHGADPCDGQFKLTWYELPAKRGYLVEAASVMEDDPAMGSFVLGMGHALVVDPH
jgi:hypothetical protein